MMIGTNFGIFRPNSASTTSSSAAPPPPVQVVDERPQGQLSDFMLQLEDYTPTIPDPITAYFLNASGFGSHDPRIVRLISIASQKFISDVAAAALQHAKTRTNTHSGPSKVPKAVKERKYTLTMDDLTPALADYGITVRKAQYFP